MPKYITLLLLIVLSFSCSKEETLPKPKAFLRLEYENTAYKATDIDCPYQFEYASKSILNTNSKCWVNIKYPHLKASLNITYRPVENNLIELLKESEKLTYKHSIKAEGISAQPFENFNKRTYGSLLEVTGNAASPLQFHITDSTRHFITGSLYFKVQPNYDSILPAIKHIEKDIKHIMETITWKK